MGHSGTDLRRKFLLLLCVALASPGGPTGNRNAEAQTSVDSMRIRGLIDELDAPQFERRDAAYRRLLELGESAIPQLADALESRSAEVRYRARRVISLTHERGLTHAFTELAALENDEIDVERGMWLIARIVDPACSLLEIQKTFDELADRVRRQLEANGPPGDADPPRAIAALQQVLFVEFGLRGNDADYTNPDNSSIAAVLRTRKGLPITLSQVVIAVARRAGIPIVGVPTPGRYIVKYDGRRAPQRPVPDIYLNPYEGGRVFDREAWERNFFGLEPENVQVGTSREMLQRMMVNLESHLFAAGRNEQGQLANKLQLILIGKSD
jgi:regulator of sirC expression with transglutaminase-like and TPR domain